MDYKASDFTKDEQAVLKYIRVMGAYFTLKEFKMMQKEREISGIKEPEKVFQGLAEKGMAKIEVKDSSAGDIEYTFYYGMSSNGEFYDAVQAYWDARELQDRICP